MIPQLAVGTKAIRLGILALLAFGAVAFVGNLGVF